MFTEWMRKERLGFLSEYEALGRDDRNDIDEALTKGLKASAWILRALEKWDRDSIFHEDIVRTLIDENSKEWPLADELYRMAWCVYCPCDSKMILETECNRCLIWYGDMKERWVYYNYIDALLNIWNYWDAETYLNYLRPMLPAGVYEKGLELSHAIAPELPMELTESLNNRECHDDSTAYRGCRLDYILPYLAEDVRVSLCNMDTLNYENYDSIRDMPAEYDNDKMRFRGMGAAWTEFPDNGNLCIKPCMEIMWDEFKGEEE